MDPKVQKNLTDALEELEEKLKPLQNLDALSENLTKAGGDLSATAKALEQSGKPFPEALAALKRASDLLSEASTLIKNADPKVVAEGLGKVDSSLKSLNTELRNAIEDQRKNTVQALDEAAGKIGVISKDVDSISQKLADIKEHLSREIAENRNAISKENEALSESVNSTLRRTRIFAIASLASSLILGTAIIVILLTASS